MRTKEIIQIVIIGSVLLGSIGVVVTKFTGSTAYNQHDPPLHTRHRMAWCVCR